MKDNVFCYATPPTLITALGSATPEIEFASDSDFEVFELRATNQAANAVLMNIGLSNGELFNSTPVDTSLFSGSAYPVRFPFPSRLEANTRLRITLLNTTGGNLTTQIQLWGYKRNRE